MYTSYELKIIFKYVIKYKQLPTIYFYFNNIKLIYNNN